MYEGVRSLTNDLGDGNRRTQVDPGFCFYLGYMIPHTQYAWMTNMTNSTTKNRATLKDKQNEGLNIPNFASEGHTKLGYRNWW